ncbi:hypothetical protein [Thioalkalivibrio sp. ALE9]|uniref:hypothetical protein n=1 Tax=Thioalkalivibrio sp. ALE9 TaxID=1158169 RepID=UPI001E2D21A5|nr:hypothetical protein [Thioalkalivibrio sp. ALE9]
MASACGAWSGITRATPVHEPACGGGAESEFLREYPLKLFVHIPKTAGTSLRHRLEANLGSRLACDYGPDHPLTHPELKASAGRAQGELRDALERAGVSVLYGHTRYPLWNEAFSTGEVMSILRHPVDRCISHYQHFLSHGGAPEDPLATGVATGQLTLQEFAAAVQQRNLQAHQLGITEASLGSLGDFGLLMTSEDLSFRLELGERRNRGRRSFSVTSGDIDAILENNALDMKLYELVRQAWREGYWAWAVPEMLRPSGRWFRWRHFRRRGG